MNKKRHGRTEYAAFAAQGRRVRNVTPSATYTHYDCCLLFRETLVTRRPSLITGYFWGRDLPGSFKGAGGVGGLLYLTVSNSNSQLQLYVPFYDNNGNITRYCDAQGNVVAEYTYDAFGNTIAQSGPMADNFAFHFSTKYYDKEIGLYYYGFRYYHPPLMRWINRDPIEEDGGLNLYGFCGNNPVISCDPDGESFEDVANFCAGVGDALTFGITRLFRRGINRAMEGNWDDPADTESTAYFAGEVTEVTVEIVVTLGEAVLRHTAKVTSRVAVEGGARSAYRRAHGLVGKGGEVHHINPIKGHISGKPARFPLPYEWAAKGEWNMTWYATRAEHQAAHNRMMMLEAIDKYRVLSLGTRQGANHIMNKLNSSSETKCWDSIDISVDVYHYEDTGIIINAVPESVFIQTQEYGRER